jgi:hypothetical protein
MTHCHDITYVFPLAEGWVRTVVSTIHVHANTASNRHILKIRNQKYLLAVSLFCAYCMYIVFVKHDPFKKNCNTQQYSIS